MALRKIGRVGGDAVGNESSLHVLPVRQAQVLLGSDIAEHGSPHGPNVGSPNCAGDVVVARGDVRSQRSQGVERGLMAPFELLPHVLRNLVERYMAWPFIHHLDALGPGPLRQLTLDLKLAKLGFVIGILDAARTKAVTNAQGHVVLLADVQDVIPVLVRKVLLVFGDAKFGVDGAAAADDASQTLGSQGNEAQKNPRVDGPVVHALFGLFDQSLAKLLPGQVFCDAIHLLQSLVDRHSAHWHSAVPNDPFPGLVDVLSRAQVHEGICTPQRTPLQLLHFFLNVRGHSGIANVGVDLHLEMAPDDHGFRLRMLPVRRNDGTSPCHLRPHELGIHSLTLCDEGHFLGDDTLLRIVHLRASSILCHFASFDPLLPKLGQSLPRVSAMRPAGVIDVQVSATRILIRQMDAADRNPQRFTGGLVGHLRVHLLGVWVSLRELKCVLELRVVGITGRARALQWALAAECPVLTTASSDSSRNQSGDRGRGTISEPRSTRARARRTHRGHGRCCSKGGNKRISNQSHSVEPSKSCSLRRNYPGQVPTV
mmetsp:Transcript_44052/g.82364  ORF Transcript_44052/g.82364 Transcript_44052/m.82364 type:complete len:541 (-) Transcript_44052:47-1669(-)